MHVLITGGAGFLGKALAAQLLRRGHLAGVAGGNEQIERITLTDVVGAEGFDDRRVVPVSGDIADRTLLQQLITTQTTAIFHLAAVVSGQAEVDFDLGMRVNLDGTRTLLEVCRAVGHRPRVVFASSVAVYGGALPEVVLDSTPLTPQTSYGTQKAIGELLVADYTRKGFVDGRSLRLPTVTVRPGKPNAAASSFASGIIREPVNGEESVCPVERSTRMWVICPATGSARIDRSACPACRSPSARWRRRSSAWPVGLPRRGFDGSVIHGSPGSWTPGPEHSMRTGPVSLDFPTI
jgi:nucleoside-diphosphate-sugar epimerase